VGQTIRHHLASCPATIGGGTCSCEQEMRHYLRLARWSFGLCIFELVGALLSGSVALASDAVHVLLDGAENILSASVSWLARSYGHEAQMRRVGGKISAVLLLVAAWGILHEGWDRIQSPREVEWQVIPFAFLGLLVTLYQKLAHDVVPGEHRNLTHLWQDRHLRSDIAGQAAVLIGGSIMTYVQGWYWIDGVLSMAIGLLIMLFVVSRLLGLDVHSHGHGDHHHPH
jgi:cobalt-zinc-cadmium efflux system protein